MGTAGLLRCLATAFTLLCLGHDAHAGYDCSKPCAMTVAPVCVSDGFTVQNECLAACQGLKVVSTGACKGDVASFANSTQGVPSVAATGAVNVTAASVSAAAMARFQAEGFFFTGIGVVASNPKVTLPTISMDDFKKMQSTNASADMYKTSVRYTSDGYVYVRPASASVKAQTSDVTSPFAGNVSSGGGGGSRKLRHVLGANDRVKIPTSAGFYPYTAVGLLEMNGGSCSAALIGPKSILTAGHCVHGGKGGSWYNGFKFYPARSGSSQPYSFSDWDSVNTFSCWSGSSDYKCDAAVIVLRRDLRSLGYFGMDNGIWPSTSGWGFTAGYPGDKPYGTMWQDTCPINKQDLNGIITTKGVDGCDVFQGQSGSPLWRYQATSTGEKFPYIKGVISHEVCNMCGSSCCVGAAYRWNNFWQITPDKWNTLTSWRK